MPFSPCGCVVEFVRSCYSSTWRVNADDPDQIVKGRYVFAEPGTPHLEHPHTLFSLNWLGEHEHEWGSLGETSKKQRKWTNGGIFFQPPPAVPVGDEREFRGHLSNNLPGDFIDGFDSRCWTNLGLPFTNIENLCMFNSCCLQIAYARCLELIAQERFNRVHLFFRRMIGDDIQQVSALRAFVWVI